MDKINGRKFFDRYSKFYETSETSAVSNRLNARYEAIIGLNRDIIKGKNVLDIASHDGRWAFASVEAGAHHVTGIEPRENLVNNAKRTFEDYNVSDSKYEFIIGDVFK